MKNQIEEKCVCGQTFISASLLTTSSFSLSFFFSHYNLTLLDSTRELGEVRGKRGGEEGVIDGAKKLAQLLVVGEIAA